MSGQGMVSRMGIRVTLTAQLSKDSQSPVFSGTVVRS